MNERECDHCRAFYTPRRSTSRYCSDRCRKDVNQKKQRRRRPVNAANSSDERRRQSELYERNMLFAEMYYSRPPADRPVFLIELIDAARNGDTKVKRVLENQVFLRANPLKDRRVFWRYCGAYPPVAQEAHRLCKAVTGVGVQAVLRGPSDRIMALKEAELSECVDALSVPPSGRGVGRSAQKALQKRELSPLARQAYEAALEAGGVSVVRTVRRDAA